jgi:dTDP-4-amino-4,6-dideoxygalactose transaminase
MKVPFLDLKAQYQTIKPEIDAAIAGVIEQTAFAGGPFVQKFEQEFASYCGTAHSAAVGNGTDALWLALIGLGVKPGDEVITSPNTFIATAEAISLAGARPVFVDIDEKTHTIDPARIEAAITPRTRAIIPVHLFGQTADMDPILAIARKRGLVVVEDACQAHGAEYKGKRAGSLGHAGCFSFYPGKNLGAYGEGGAVVTSDAELDKRMKVFRDHGQTKKYHHAVVGWNARLDGIQGAILSVKLPRLDGWNGARRANAARYREKLSGVPGIILPEEAPWAKHVYHLFVVRVKERDRVLAELAGKDVHCGIHYPVPLHLTEAYAFLGHKAGDFPVAERCAAEYLSLPMFPELSGAQVEQAAASLRESVASGPSRS